MSPQFVEIFDSLEEAFLYYTECQLATLDDYQLRKGISKTRIIRQRSIAFGMVEECKRRGIKPRQGLRLPRVRQLLETGTNV